MPLYVLFYDITIIKISCVYLFMSNIYFPVYKYNVPLPPPHNAIQESTLKTLPRSKVKLSIGEMGIQ